MKNYIRFGTILILAVLSAACNNPFVPKDNSGTGNPGPGYGTVYLDINGSPARTTLPAAKFDNYVYTFTKSGGAPQALQPANGTFTLEVGNWHVDVKAYIGTISTANLAAWGAADFTLAETGASASIKLQATENSGEGTFKYNIQYPSGTIAEISLQKYAGTEAYTFTGPDGTTAFSGEKKVPAGFYVLTVLLGKNGNYAGTSEVIHIYNLLTSEYGTANTPIAFADADFTIVKLTFDGKGSTSGNPDSQFIVSGDKAKIPADPVKTKNKFLGWYTAANVKWDFNNPVKESITLYAKWLDYSALRLNEVNGNQKFVEIYNSGTADISMDGVKLQRNDGPDKGGSEWTGGSADVIPAGKYRLFAFSNDTPFTIPAGFDTNPAYVGWNINTGISSGQILKVALVDTTGNNIDAFIRGDNPLPAWGSTSGITPDIINSYSRMADSTWVYAAPTPGAANGARAGEIVSPGYLTLERIDPPAIASLSKPPLTVTANDEVTVTATVTTTTSAITPPVILKWTLGSTTNTINMTAGGNVYSAKIPKNSADSEISYWISATNNRGETAASAIMSYKVTAVDALPPDYTKLKLNEVSGVTALSGAAGDAEKFYELINIGDKDISLAGCTIYYNANGSTGGVFPPASEQLTWTGLSTQTIKAGQLFSLIGRDNPAGTSPGSFTTGLTASRILIITLKDPSGNVIDQCIRAADTGDYAITDKSFSRIPDGTGNFYFAAPSRNATNGTSNTGLKLLPQTPPPPPAGVDYSKLKLNEVSGVGTDDQKFYELKNTGTADIPLAGCTIYYNANGATGGVFPPTSEQLTWTGLSTQTIKAGQLFSLIGRNGGSSTVAHPGSFTTGLTAARILIITLKDPAGNVIDQCARAYDTGAYAFTDKSFSRIPDGTGIFYFTAPTPNATNGTSTNGLTLVPQTPDNIPLIAPVFSQPSGLYSSTFNLTLNANGNTIYYSTDGSIPLPEKADITGTNVYTFHPEKPITIVDRNNPAQDNVLATAYNLHQMQAKDKEVSSSGRIINYTDANFTDATLGLSPFYAQVPKATVIRAMAVAGNQQSAVITKTYFVGSSSLLDKFPQYPILSIVSDPFNLVSESKGILVRGDSSKSWKGKNGVSTNPTVIENSYNFQQKGIDWEREAYLEFFDGGSRSVPMISSGVGIRVRGGYSTAAAQKSFNVYFKSLYGLDSFQSTLIPGAVKADGVTPMGKYKSFVLRNAGNDYEQTKIIDVFTQDLLRDRNFTTQASEPCILYLNGEYWGPYNLQEKYSDNHTQYKYGVDNANVISFENGELDDGLPSEANLFSDMVKWVLGRDMSVDANYKTFCNTYFDIINFVDYWAANVYVDNYDWPNNNIRVWKTRTLDTAHLPYGDTKWRWQMFDLDAAYKNTFDDGVPHDTIDNILKGTGKANLLFRALLANRDFCTLFVNTIMDLYNVNFNPNSAQGKLTDYITRYSPIMASYFPRWGSTTNASSWVFNDYTTKIGNYLNNIRTKMTGTFLPAYFGGGYALDNANTPYTSGKTIPQIIGPAINPGLYSVTLSATGASGAAIKINTITPNLAPSWTGKYYAGVPIPITAIVPSGSQFAGWTVTGAAVADSANPETTVTITGNATITANYK